MSSQTTRPVSQPADSHDVRRILGELDDAKVSEILVLGPTLADLEDVAICLAGDHDVLAKSGHHVPVTAQRIIELLSEEEETEPER
jgi:hypothetical protein